MDGLLSALAEYMWNTGVFPNSIRTERVILASRLNPSRFIMIEGGYVVDIAAISYVDVYVLALCLPA